MICKTVPAKVFHLGLPWWSNGEESACQCRVHRFDPWSRIPHATGNWACTPQLLSPSATSTLRTLEPTEVTATQSSAPQLEKPPLPAARESLLTEMKTWYSEKEIIIFFNMLHLQGDLWKTFYKHKLLITKINLPSCETGSNGRFKDFPVATCTTPHAWAIAKDLSLFPFPTLIKQVHYINDMILWTCDDLPLR